jgi:hypothetical protein
MPLRRRPHSIDLSGIDATKPYLQGGGNYLYQLCIGHAIKSQIPMRGICGP